MNSRMDKYEQTEKKYASRTSRNKELYDAYDAVCYDKFDINSNIEVLKNDANRIDVEQIRDMLDKKYRDNLPKRKSISLDVPEEPVRKQRVYDTKEYDINSILDKVKSEQDVDYDNDRITRTYNSSTLVDEVKKKYAKPEKAEEEQELVDLINTITELELRNRKKDADLLGLGDEDDEEEEETEEVVEEPVKDTVEVKEDDSSFYTGQLAVTEEDFDDFDDMRKDIQSNSTLIKVLIFIFVLMIIAGGVFFANSYFNLGLF